MDLPVAWANPISMLLFVILGVAVWSIPKSVLVPPEFAHQSWRDLRWWATGLILFQIMLYGYFS